MDQTKTLVQKRIKIQNDDLMSKLTKSLYEDTFDENCFTPDLILKTGPEKCEFYCHRLIFAASSDFVRTIIATATIGTIPVILVPDLKTSVMQYVLKYIYLGETMVPFDKYVDFMEACNLLQLKGPINEMKPVSQDVPQFEDSLEVSLKVQTNNQDDKAKGQNEKEPFIREMSVESDESEEPNIEGLEVENLTREAKASNNIQNYKTRRELKELTPAKKTVYENRLMFCLTNTYKKHRVLINSKVEKRIKSSKLIIEKMRLLKGEHMCGLCGVQIFLSYNARGNSLSWFNTALSKHLKRFH